MAGSSSSAGAKCLRVLIQYFSNPCMPHSHHSTGSLLLPVAERALHMHDTLDASDRSAGQQYDCTQRSANDLSHFTLLHPGSTTALHTPSHPMLCRSALATVGASHTANNRWQMLDYQQQQLRGIFGAPARHQNLQIHTHDKYKIVTEQPVYKWMQGRFVMDRNGTVWHKQANSNSKHHAKSSNTLSRVSRWKSLHPTYAAKFRKLPGVKDMLKYWSPPDARTVPGFEGDRPYQATRVSGKPDKRPVVGDRALRPH